MSSHGHKSTKPTKPSRETTNQTTTTTSGSRSSSSTPSLSTHLAMVELKQRIITSLSKLADRDTHQIALEDLHSIIQTLSHEALPMLLNSLYDSLSDQSNFKPAVKKESLHLLSLTCQSHKELTLPHLTKMITHIVKRLKDPDSSVRDACKDTIGVLSGLYLKGGGGGGGEGGGGGGGDGNGAVSLVGLFVRPLFEAMGEQNKIVQSSAAMCMAKMVECAAVDGDAGGGAGVAPVGAFQKLCPRICKLLSGQSFVAKSALLGVVASLSQVGAISPQGLEALLQVVNECLSSLDWATRKAAAEALSALALNSSNLVTERAASSTLTALEACRFDKIKPARESMTEALQLWKRIADKGDGVSDDHPNEQVESDKHSKPGDQKADSSAKDSSSGSSPNVGSAVKTKGGGILDKAVVILKKKASGLTDRELNPEFFQNLETRGTGELPVEVVVPRRCLNQSSLNNEGESETNYSEPRGRLNRIGNGQSDNPDGSSTNKHRIIERGTAGRDLRGLMLEEDKGDVNQRELPSGRTGVSKNDGQPEGSSASNKANWLAIQRQLLQLERQQAHLMNMLQDFMGGSHDSMVTLENRVRGLERVVEDMARDLSISAGRRGGNYPMGPLGKYNGYSDYSGSKYNGRVPFGERYSQSDVTAAGSRGRSSHWRSDTSDAWDAPAYGSSRNGQVGVRRTAGSSSIDPRSPKSDHELDQVGNRRAWDKGTGPVRLGEGPSARSVWQASKDEATLEAIRVAGEDGGLSRAATRGGVPELTADAMGDELVRPERDPIWTSWSNAMDAVKLGDLDTAYAEVVSTGDDQLLVKLMSRSGPVIDQLTNETACDVLHAIGQFLLEQSLYDICLSWIQQLVEIVQENGADVLGTPMELKKEMLLNLDEAASTIDPPEDWEGAAPDELLLQLASAWGIEIQHTDK